MSTRGEFGLLSELLAAVLQHLPHDELRNASQVSRGFYRAAHDAGLTLHHNVHAFGAGMLETLTDIVKHAESLPYLFTLSLSLTVYHRSGNQEPLWELEDTWNTMRRAMPFLVALDIRVEKEVTHLVYAGLDAPAPQLGTFSIETCDDLSGAIDIPATLFGGDAPRLQSVDLSGHALPPTAAPIPAFRGVRALTLGSYVPGQAVEVARFFPALRRLALIALFPGDGDPRSVDLGGLTLDNLTVINDFDVPLVYTAPARLLAVKDLSAAPRYDAALWPDTETPLHARIETEHRPGSEHPRPGWIQAPAHCEVLTVGSPAADGWGYTHYATPVAGEPSTRTLPALEALPPLWASLASLTVEAAMLVRMLRTESTLAALRELYVACAPAVPGSKRKKTGGQPAPDSSRVSLRCPALERITLFATQQFTPVSLGRERIAPLGELRGTQKSVLLVLASVAVNGDNRDGPLLRDVFCQVRVVEEDATTCAPAYYHKRKDNPRFVRGATWAT